VLGELAFAGLAFRAGAFRAVEVRVLRVLLPVVLGGITPSS
jgi:hypothetical protein